MHTLLQDFDVMDIKLGGNGLTMALVKTARQNILSIILNIFVLYIEY